MLEQLKALAQLHRTTPSTDHKTAIFQEMLKIASRGISDSESLVELHTDLETERATVARSIDVADDKRIAIGSAFKEANEAYQAALDAHSELSFVRNVLRNIAPHRGLTDADMNAITTQAREANHE